MRKPNANHKSDGIYLYDNNIVFFHFYRAPHSAAAEHDVRRPMSCAGIVFQEAHQQSFRATQTSVEILSTAAHYFVRKLPF